MQGEGERCPSPTRSPILAIPDVVLRADSSSVSFPLGHSDQAGPALSASGQDLAPSTWDLEAVGMAHPELQVLTSGLLAEVQETIASARAPSTGKLYSSKWKVFESRCLAHAADPVSCHIGLVLESLQEKLAAGAAAPTLRVYVAAIAAQRKLDEIPIGRRQMVSAFMRGVRSETSTPCWSSFLGLISRPWGCNGSPILALRVSSRTDSHTQGYSFVGANVFEKSWGLASSLCQWDVYGLRPRSCQSDLTA